MTRLANKPLIVPEEVQVDLNGQVLKISGKKGSLNLHVHDTVDLSFADNQFKVRGRSMSKVSKTMTGTTFALVRNMIVGVSSGFEKKLLLQGVGFRAQLEDKILTLALGFSHPIYYKIPEGVTLTTPSQTEITVQGHDKQKVGQTAAEIRQFYKPEPYKGKGVRYADEKIRIKAGKKK